VGDLVVTTLSNDYMPLIRYRIGDLVQRTGHAGQAAFIVHGRAKDVFPLPRGERATGWQIDQCFTGIDGVLHYELSATASLLRLRLVPDRMPPTDADLAELVRRLAATLPGYPTPTVEIVDAVLAGPSGKFRLCHPGGP